MICKCFDSIIKKAEVKKKDSEDLQNCLESAEEERQNRPIEELTLEELNKLEDKMKSMHVGIQGKKNIKVEQVQADTDTKQVTFSKRRMGEFKKASKLVTLCNAEVGIVVLSTGEKSYSFGKPNFDFIADGRFKNEPQESGSGGTSSGHIKGDTTMQEKMMGKRLYSIIEKAEVEKKEGEYLQNRLESAEEERLNPIEELTLEELNELEAKMKKMLVGIQGNINKMQASSSLMFLSKDN